MTNSSELRGGSSSMLELHLTFANGDAVFVNALCSNCIAEVVESLPHPHSTPPLHKARLVLDGAVLDPLAKRSQVLGHISWRFLAECHRIRKTQ